VGTEDARLICVQPSVCTPGKFQHNGSANVSEAHGGRASSGVSGSAITRALAARNGCCRDTLTGPMTKMMGEPVGDWRSIRRAGME
jgi:hypothetical protein